MKQSMLDGWMEQASVIRCIKRVNMDVKIAHQYHKSSDSSGRLTESSVSTQHCVRLLRLQLMTEWTVEKRAAPRFQPRY